MKVKERIEAKNQLEQYVYQVRQTLNEEKLKGQFTDDEKKSVETKVDEVLKWSNDNPAASKEEYDQKVKERIEAKNLCEQYCYQVKLIINNSKLKD